MTASLRLLRRHLTVLRRTWWANATFNFFEPLFYLTAFGSGLGAFVQDMDGMGYLEFVASGMVAASAMWAPTFECSYGAFVRMNFQKMFHAMLFTPVTVTDVVVGEVLYGAVKSLLFGAIILGVVAAMGLVASWWAVLLPPALVLPGLAFAFMALAYATVVDHIDHLNYYVTLIMTPLFLISGVFFPVSTLPGWVQGVAWFSPLYHSVAISRILIRGTGTGELGGHLLFLAVFTLAVAGLPVYFMRRKLIN